MVQENSLSDLPETLAQCTQLRVLDIRHNKLCEIPQVVYKLHNLTHLFLRFNRIRVVDEEIKYLTVRKIEFKKRLFIVCFFCSYLNIFFIFSKVYYNILMKGGI